jgi:hypothetical protein
MKSEKPSTKILNFWGIRHKSGVYEFTKELPCVLTSIKHGFSLENKQLGLFVMSKNYASVMRQFKDEFVHIYIRYNELPEDKLSEDVKRIKTALNELVIK